MSILKKPYEISLWKDVLVFVYEDGETTDEKIVSGHGAVVAQYYDERKMFIIGSDTMDTPMRATQPKLVSKLNGENVLTFNMYSHYYNEQTGEMVKNPFINYLINERKIKLRYGPANDKTSKWYDLVIKNIQENSETKTYTYTAKDLFINELSKSGFDLEFDSELENSMGTIEELGERVLAESDWRLKPTGEKLKQTVEEPLYLIQLKQSIKVKNMENESETLVIASGKFVYGFYNNIVNKQSFVQFLYNAQGVYEIDDDHVITNSPNWIIVRDDGSNVTYNSEGLPDFAASMAISDEYRGRRLVHQVLTRYDATIDKYVNVYKDGDREIYGYTEVEYTSPATVRSYITNPTGFSSYAGWEVGGYKTTSGEITFPKLDLITVPDVRDVTAEDVLEGKVDFLPCLQFTPSNTNQVLYNSGLIDFRHYINGFIKGEKYVFRVKYGEAGESGAHGPTTLKQTAADLKLTVKKYDLVDGVYETAKDENKADIVYFQGQVSSSESNAATDYKYAILTCKRTLSYAEMVEMTNSLGLFVASNQNKTIYIEDVQFYPYNDNGTPGGLKPNEYQSSEVKTVYYYYIPNSKYKSIDEVEFVYKGYEPAKYAEQYSGTGYEKIRSITASESNRFNLLQELSELFECWTKFEVEHDTDGKISLDEEYRQKKWVSFHEYIYQQNYAGFKYGINLKSIQRTIESDAIVSKLIVKNNSNEYGKDGFCSIARASESQSGENFILDFSYYIQQGLLGMGEITNDLYSDYNKFIGYYAKLKKINEKRDLYIEQQAGLITDISEYSASYQTYSMSAAEAEKQYRDKQVLIKNITGRSFKWLMEHKSSSWWENEQVINTVSAIGRLKSVATSHTALAEIAKKNLDEAQKQYDKLKRVLTSRELPSGEEEKGEERLLLEKEELHSIFYKKYSRFLQEGSWISEDYIDDNLYYLDAQSTLHTSSQPKVVYNIAVLELSQLEEYKNYTYALGDKTTIEDTEFFGWVLKDGLKTPYREEIIVTELIYVFDSPEQNQIKVQNFKTSFEDLFQRMAATTQKVEYSTGEYDKVTGIVQEDGTIDIMTLQNSIANNALIIKNAKDQSVVWDDTGITTTSPSDPANVLRIVNGGLFLSRDGGLTWRTGVTGEGINADYITTGQLNVDQVNILHGGHASFRWDSYGISAFAFTLDSNGNIEGYNSSQFIRMDQYGLYGINGYDNFNASISENGLVGQDKIKKHANFALTWSGFQIKSNNRDGYISITSDKDFQVIGTNDEEYVKIGLLDDKPQNVYGLRLTSWYTENKERKSRVVLEQGTDGLVWIRDELKVGTLESSVSIGYLEGTKDLVPEFPKKDFEDDAKIREVINANNKFMVYEDGSMRATEGYFVGEIYATGGEIGGVKIESLVNPDFEVIIESDSGTVFKDNTKNKTLTARLYKGTDEIPPENLQYQWYKNSEEIKGAKAQQIQVAITDLDPRSDQATYTCKITYE